jgi:hypothetical protein
MPAMRHNRGSFQAIPVRHSLSFSARIARLTVALRPRTSTRHISLSLSLSLSTSYPYMGWRQDCAAVAFTPFFFPHPISHLGNSGALFWIMEMDRLGSRSPRKKKN